MDSIIKVEGLSKRYKQYGGRIALMRELVLRKRFHRELWALRDISFEVGPGESFGLIGDNGAGKSTLLKILCGTTYATRGTARIGGSVSSLLELGTGFDPEFTGRENIYFNGVLMGYSREDVSRIEDEIVAFSELGDFIDEPVKTYSSGMYVRLGFSVATGFAPDILVIDEALAVGDQSFQKKCTDRILEFRDSGTTILFCSHNLYQVKKLCRRALWLEEGRPAMIGEAGEVVERYTDRIRSRQERTGRPKTEKSAGDSICRLQRFRLTDGEGTAKRRFQSGKTLRLEIWARFGDGFKGTPGIGVSILRNDGTMVYTTSSGIDGARLRPVQDGLLFGCIVFPELPLLTGSYSFTLSATDQHNLQVYDLAENVEPFTIDHPGADFGLASLRHSWEND